jgi:hypothetical protein
MSAIFISPLFTVAHLKTQILQTCRTTFFQACPRYDHSDPFHLTQLQKYRDYVNKYGSSVDSAVKNHVGSKWYEGNYDMDRDYSYDAGGAAKKKRKSPKTAKKKGPKGAKKIGAKKAITKTSLGKKKIAALKAFATQHKVAHKGLLKPQLVQAIASKLGIRKRRRSSK